MAILREGITIGNNYVDEIRTAASDLASISNDVLNYLNANGNFQTFREGTERGAAIYNNLKTCVSTVVEKLVPTVDKIASTTSALFNEQQNLNKAEAQSNDRMF